MTGWRGNRPLSGALVLGVVLMSCHKPPPTPDSVTIAIPSECREGDSIPVAAEVRDKTGALIDVAVQWGIDPQSGLTIDGTSLACHAEGNVKVTATAGTANVTKNVTVTSPLIGTWVRRGDEKDGLTVKVEPSAEGLMGYVVETVGEGALPYIKKEKFAVPVDYALKCLQQQWAPGIKKWKTVRRLTPTKWSLSDLSKSASIGRHCNPFIPGGNCYNFCKPDKPEFGDNYELTLIDPTHLELRDSTKGTDTVQKWERATDLPEGGTPVTGEAGADSTGEASAVPSQDASTTTPDADAAPADTPEAPATAKPSAAPQISTPHNVCLKCPAGYYRKTPRYTGACFCVSSDQQDSKDPTPPSRACRPTGPCADGCGFTCP